MSYADFLANKSRVTNAEPVPHGDLPAHLFPHQRDLVSWALRRGRAAVFADTGLGKTRVELEWARACAEHGRVLMLAPLAVAEQTVREGQIIGVDVEYARSDKGARITIANYEMLHAFDVSKYVGIVLDESSILKAQDGKTRTQLIECFRNTRWRLAATATPAPNDFTELGNHSQFLGVKSHQEMLSEYFVHDGGETQTWRLKGHAEKVFWRWVCSWGAVVKRPSDLGHSDEGYVLPPLRMHETIIGVDHKVAQKAGMLFADEVRTLNDQRATRRATLDQRVDAVVKIVRKAKGPVLVWCELNDEANAIESAVKGAVQVAGADSLDDKRERLLGFADGKYRVLVTKPSVAGHGMNWQHCNTMVFAGVSNSYEQTYQAIRRCWRFGQKKPVDVHVIRAETEGAIVQNLRRKEADAERLAVEMVEHVKDMMRDEIKSAKREWNDYVPSGAIDVPSWLASENA